MAMKIKVLITVKTYPTFSGKYEELVCTAGFTENAEWIRLYPIQFRKLDYSGKYKKWEWIELDVIKNSDDPRKESFRPTNIDQIEVVGKVSSENGKWTARKQFAFKRIFKSMEELVREAKDPKTCTSLATFKPKRVIDFIWEEEDEREWNSEKLQILNQTNLFERNDSEFKVVKKLPYKFIYRFESESGAEHQLMIEDWEVGALFWRGMNKFNNEQKACEYVKEKFFHEFLRKNDLYFFLGTTKAWHFVSPQPFIIIGTFHPLFQQQTALL
jgi:hypothetical protein